MKEPRSSDHGSFLFLKYDGIMESYSEGPVV